METNKAFAEIIESSLAHFLAQSWQWDQLPSFGSLVTVQAKKRTIIALVYQIQTGSMEPTRYPFPYKKTEAELRAEQPQIFEFLKTSFSCLPIGYQEQGALIYLTPPEPAPIHGFVMPAPSALSKQFFYSTTYLHLVFAADSVSNKDELLLALLHQQKALNLNSDDHVRSFIDTYALLTGNDYRRLKLFLARAQRLVG